MHDDPYATLGVPRTATAEEIRKAYRSLARKNHPDLNPDDPQAKERFQKIQSAFDTLNDPEKRKRFDRYGTDYDPTSAGAGGPAGGWSGRWNDVDLEELLGRGAGGGRAGGGFADLFRQFSQGARGGSSRRPSGGGGGSAAAPVPDVVEDLQIPFATAVLGGEAEVAVARGGPTERLRVTIPAGIEDGKKIRLRGKGRRDDKGRDGDLLIRIHVAPHPVFRRSGKRLDMTLPITLGEALAGAKIEAPTPHGTIALAIPAGASSGLKLRVRGHGIRAGEGEPGDLFVELQIVLPPSLTAEDRQALAAIAASYAFNPRGEIRW